MAKINHNSAPAASLTADPVLPVVTEGDTIENILNTETDADVPNESNAATTEPTAEGGAQPVQGETAQVTDATPATGRTSTKTREARNVPEGFTTTWVPIDVSAEESLILKRAAKILKTNVAEMLSEKLTPAYHAVKEEFKAEADKFVPTRAAATTTAILTDDELVKAQAKLNKMEEANKKLAEAIAARLAQKAALAAPVVTDEDEDSNNAEDPNEDDDDDNTAE